MAIWSDLITPQNLTVFTRRSIDAIESGQGSLSQFFPNISIDGDTAKYTMHDNSLVDTAEYRAWDTESSTGALQGGKRVAIELPPVSHKMRVGELDTIRDRNDTNNQLRIVARATANTITAVLNRIEVARADVLQSGRFVVSENGFKVDVDLGRSADMSVTAATKWNASGADILADLNAWTETYIAKNGVAPATILGSRAVLSYLQRDAGLRAIITGTAVQPLVSVDQLNALFASYSLPTFQLFDRQVRVQGVSRRLLDSDKVFLLPAAGTNELGQTIFGRTAESEDPAYGLASADAPGMVSALHRTWDPYGVWTHVNAVAMPVMTNPNASMVAEVL